VQLQRPTASGLGGVKTILKPGILLIERDTRGPDCFELEGGSKRNGWISVGQELSRREPKKELAALGRTFFFSAGAIRDEGSWFRPGSSWPEPRWSGSSGT
jgi:hypothetical protein